MRGSIVFLFLLFMPFLVWSQKYSFKQLSLEEGLSNRHVLDIAHDKEGYVWMATEFGLNRFSGTSFRKYFKSDQMDGSSVNSNEINCLYYDEDVHKLYIGTKSNGLNVLDLHKNSFSYYMHDPQNPKSIGTNDITDIIKGIDGAIWIATYHRGIQRFDPGTGTFTRFDKKELPKLGSNSVWSLTQDHRGIFYIGHVNQGITLFNPNTLECTMFSGQSSLPDKEVKVVFCDSERTVWIGTREGLAAYNPVTAEIKKIPLPAPASMPFIYSIQEIGDKIWVGSESSAVYTIPKTAVWNKGLLLSSLIERVDQYLGPDVSVQDISKDQFGNVWLANYGAGTSFLSHIPTFFSQYPSYTTRGKENRLYSVSALVEEPAGAYWLATEGNGIMRLENYSGSEAVVTPQRSINEKYVFTAFKDREERLWFGLTNGAAVYDQARGNWNQIGKDREMNEVRAITQDSHGNIWLASRDALHIYDTSLGGYYRFTVRGAALGDYAARALLEDNKGFMWVGTYGQGIYVYNGKKELFKHFSVENGLPANTINHLFKDSTGTIWIATNEGMVCSVLADGYSKLEPVVMPGTQSSVIVQAITEDVRGNIWISTNSGVLQYRPKDKKIASFDKYFGVPLGGFKSGSVLQDKKGNILFGTSTGICSFNPLEIPEDISVPSVRFNTVLVYESRELNGGLQERNWDKAQGVRLPYSDNTFRIEYAVSDYALKGLVEYSYQLYGLDKNWTYVGEEQVLDFRNIPHGKYELRIRAKYKNATWTDDYVALPLHIVPPFYLSVIAIIFYILLLSGIGFFIVFFYLRKVKLENELKFKKNEHEQQERLYVERLNFFTNITHELRTPLTLILGPLEDLLRSTTLSGKQRDLVTMIQNSANRLFNLVTQLLEFRKVESEHKDLVLGEGNLGELVVEVVKKYQALNKKPELEFVYRVPTAAFNTRFDVDIMQMVLDNLLSNAYKFTTKGKIEVVLDYTTKDMTNWAVIEVRDTGLGIPEGEKDRIFERFYQIQNSDGNGTGIGLALVKELISIHHGTVHLESGWGRGSVFTVRFSAPIVEDVVTGYSLAAERNIKESEDSRISVLLVEDDVELRHYLVSVLKNDFDVTEAANGIEGLGRAIEASPDIIVSDVMMPELDGFSMVERLRSQAETSHIPVVLLTAKSTDQDRDRGYRLGIDSFLVKPIMADTLKSRLNNILQKRKELYMHFLNQQTPEEDVPATTSDKNSFNVDVLRSENKFIQEVVALIEGRLQDAVLDVQFLSEKMNMSSSTLYRKVKALTGKNVNQFIRKVRMIKAAELLKSGDYNITEVAFLVGINSLIYFRQCFKEEFGQLPSEFVKDQQAK